MIWAWFPIDCGNASKSRGWIYDPRFRHVVRNVYAESLDPLRVRELVDKLASLWMQLRDELSVFADFLEGVSRADDVVG